MAPAGDAALPLPCPGHGAEPCPQAGSTRSGPAGPEGPEGPESRCPVPGAALPPGPARSSLPLPAAAAAQPMLCRSRSPRSHAVLAAANPSAAEAWGFSRLCAGLYLLEFNSFVCTSVPCFSASDALSQAVCFLKLFYLLRCTELGVRSREIYAGRGELGLLKERQEGSLTTERLQVGQGHSSIS